MIKLKSLVKEAWIPTWSNGIFTIVRPTITLWSNGKKVKARKGAFLYNAGGNDDPAYYVDPEMEIAYELETRNPDYTEDQTHIKDFGALTAMYRRAPSPGELLKLPTGHHSILPDKDWKKWVKKL